MSLSIQRAMATQFYPYDELSTEDRKTQQIFDKVINAGYYNPYPLTANSPRFVNLKEKI